MKLPITGSCLCGSVKYQITAEPVGAGNCHCRTCQKTTASAYLPLLFVPYDALKISGTYREFTSLSASGNTMHKGFCPLCSSTLFGRNSGNTKIRPISAATLDDPSIYKPTMDFWVVDAQPWDYMNPDLPKLTENFLHL